MANPFVAEIRMFAGNFAPTGWALCNGQLMPISQNTALFSLLGTTYGGDGKSNFALPNLQGSAPMHPGQGPGLSLHDLGESGGTETVTLLQTEIPAHSHSANCLNGTAGDSNNPILWAKTAGASRQQPPPNYATTGPASVPMNPQAIGVTGGNLPHNNMSPYLAVSFIIALQGVYPPRS
ncbi:MAG TPA: tail fiber protein [Terriglobales bacterium]|nr:tail fiber protein [Terriglobales bacterium]